MEVNKDDVSINWPLDYKKRDGNGKRPCTYSVGGNREKAGRTDL